MFMGSTKKIDFIFKTHTNVAIHIMVRMINTYTYYLATCIAGLLVFSCTDPASVPSPVQSSIPYFRFATETTIIDTGTHTIRIRANEILKYSRRVRFLVSGTAFAPRDYAFATKPFVLHTPNYPNHHVKNIIEMPAGTNQIDISLTVKKQLRCEIKTIQLSIENLDGNMETLQLSLKHIPPPCVITIAGDGTDGNNNGLGTLTQFDQPRGIVTNRLGDIYVSDGNHIIRKIKSDGVTTTFVGTLDAIAFSNHGAGSFDQPTGLVFDTSNNLYVADRKNHRIRKVTSMGVVSTLAGTGVAGFMDDTNGMTGSARFRYPTGVAVDKSGNIYVADSQNHRIRKITSGGVVSTLAGTGIKDDGTVGGGFMDGAGNIAQFSNPYGVAVDSAGVIYVADQSNHRIRKITVSGTTSEVSTLAGTGIKDNGTAGGDFMDGMGNIAQFNAPNGVAVDSAGVIYVADQSNHRIRKITVSGTTSEVSTLAGGGTTTTGTPCPGTTGTTITCRDGTGSLAQFNRPGGVTVDGVNNVYVTDLGNNRIRKIITKIPTIDPICTNGTASTAKLFTANTEKCVSCDSGFGLDSELCRKELDPICTNGVASIAKVFTANTEKCVSCNSGFDKNGNLCGQFNPVECVNGITSTVKVPTANIEKCDSCDSYYALKNDETCAEIVSVEILAGTGADGFTDGMGNMAQFNFPIGVAVDSVGNVYVGDTSNHRIRKITPAKVVSTLAGGDAGGVTATATECGTTTPIISTTIGETCKDGTGTDAKFNDPYGVAVDSAGNVYVADSQNHRIRKITPAKVVSALAGGGTTTMGTACAGSTTGTCRDGTGTDAQFNEPYSVAIDSDGNVYVGDLENHRIRKITSGGVVSTLAGTGTSGFMDDTDGMAGSAQFNAPSGVAVDSDGNVYVADLRNHRIRKITPGGVVSTLAGGGITGTPCPGTTGTTITCRDGAGNVAQFNYPYGVVVDSAGNVYVADSDNHRIRKVTSTGVVSTLAGTGTSGSINGKGNVAQFNTPYGVAVDSAGNVYVADSQNHRIRKITIPQ